VESFSGSGYFGWTKELRNSVITPNASVTKIYSRIGKYRAKYSRSNSKPLIGLTFQHLEM
jgi:hypothetical protein